MQVVNQIWSQNKIIPISLQLDYIGTSWNTTAKPDKT